MTFSEFALHWLKLQRLFVRQSTYEALTVYVNVHLIPYFKDMDLTAISPGTCQDFAIDRLSRGRSNGRGGLSSVTVRKHVSVLKQILDEAVRQELIERNPAMYVKLPKLVNSTTKAGFYLSVSEARKLLLAFTDNELYPAVLIGLYYGLRRSEVLGLKWSAIDFENDTITVKHTVVKNITIIAEDCTKTESSRRTYQMLPEVSKSLRTLGLRTAGSEYLFHRSDGSPMRPDCFTWSFQRVLKRAGFPKNPIS